MRRRRRTRGLGWAVSVALLAGLLGGVWFGGSDSSASEAAAQFPDPAKQRNQVVAELRAPRVRSQLQLFRQRAHRRRHRRQRRV